MFIHQKKNCFYSPERISKLPVYIRLQQKNQLRMNFIRLEFNFKCRTLSKTLSSWWFFMFNWLSVVSLNRWLWLKIETYRQVFMYCRIIHVQNKLFLILYFNCKEKFINHWLTVTGRSEWRLTDKIREEKFHRLTVDYFINDFLH